MCNVWGSQGQPAYPQDIKSLVTPEWLMFLDHIAGSEFGSLGGLIAKANMYGLDPAQIAKARVHRYLLSKVNTQVNTGITSEL